MGLRVLAPKDMRPLELSTEASGNSTEPLTTGSAAFGYPQPGPQPALYGDSCLGLSGQYRVCPTQEHSRSCSAARSAPLTGNNHGHWDMLPAKPLVLPTGLWVLLSGEKHLQQRAQLL